MFSIPVKSGYRAYPSFLDKRLSFDGFLECTCKVCNEVSTVDGNDWIYCPEEGKRMLISCEKCEKTSEIFEIIDIRDGGIFLKKINENWSVSFQKRVVTHEHIITV